MKTEKLHNALTGIDERYLSEFDLAAAQKTRKSSAKKYISAAVASAAVFAAVFGLYKSGRLDPPVQEKTPSVPFVTQNAVGESTLPDVRDTQTDETTARDSADASPKAHGDDTGVSPVEDEQKPGDGIAGGTEDIKGGDTPELLANYTVGEDGVRYRIFHPATDTFAPLDDMTLENRFCCVMYRGVPYAPVPDGDLTPDDYLPDCIDDAIAVHYELRAANDEYSDGIAYRARVDIYKLKDEEPENAIACVISFYGETKAYKYRAERQIEQTP